MLSLMYNAWAINTGNINGPGYLKSADQLSKEEYEALKAYFLPVATQSAANLKEIQAIAQDNKNIYGLFNKIQDTHLKSSEDVKRWTSSLKKLHDKLLEILKSRVGENPTYNTFMIEESKRSLGNYQMAYQSRSTLDQNVTTIANDNTDRIGPLYDLVREDPHTEMLLRLRQGTEILYATFLNFEKQRFQIPEQKIKNTDTKNTGDIQLGDFLKHQNGEFKGGPNPLLPPPSKETP